MNERQIVKEGAIEVASMPWNRAIGLMFRKKPSPLVIVFDRELRHAIWMLFMRFPIDLIFLDSEKQVITIYENIEPISLDPRTWKIYRPQKPVKYALEVEAGWVKQKSLAPGDYFDFGC